MTDSNVLPFMSREQMRSRRKHPVRAHTVSTKRMTKRELAVGAALAGDADTSGRPKTRGECAGGARPCPFVGCAKNLFLDVHGVTGSIKLNFPHLQPEEMKHSCALDVADGGGLTLEDCADVMNLTRERIRQIEFKSLIRLRKGRNGRVLGEFTESREPVHSAKTNQRALSRLNAPLPAPVDEEPVETDMDDVIRLSFFADASGAADELGARFIDDDFVPSRTEQQLSRNVDRMYVRGLLDRGLIERKQPEGRAPFLNPDRRKPMAGEQRKQIVETFKRLESELGRRPKAIEIAESIGGGLTVTAVASGLYAARKAGALPPTVRGGGVAAPKKANAVAKQVFTAPTSSLDEVLRAELARLDDRRAKIASLLGVA